MGACVLEAGWFTRSLLHPAVTDVSTARPDSCKSLIQLDKSTLVCALKGTKDQAVGLACPITSWEIDGKDWKQCQTLFWGAPKSLQMVTAAMKLKDAYSLEGKL